MQTLINIDILVIESDLIELFISWWWIWSKCINDMSSSPHIDNKKKGILVLGKGPTQGLEHKLTAEKCIQLILQ